MKALWFSVAVLTGCLAEADDTGNSGVRSLLTSQRGVDYAWSKPSSPTALRNAGYTFAARYLSYDTTGKNLTATEAAGLFAAGIDVVANWEWGANDALDGYDTGRTQAQKALAMASALGMPGDRPIYFSVDFDATEGQQGAIDSYFDGVISVLGVQRTGAYGGYYVVKRLFDHGKIQWGWQTYAWSGGQWDPRAQLRQTQNGVHIAGSDCDIDQAVADDFGQWGPNVPASGAEGTRAFLTPNQQHLMTIDATGALRHTWWDGDTRALARSLWSNGVVGQPATFVAGNDQHVFARGTTGTLEHWFWSPSAGIVHDTWGAGITGDPAVTLIGQYQDVWATDATNQLQHWYWGPTTNGVQHDTWGGGVTGRPSVLEYKGQQHAFARGTGGTLEHFWWDPATNHISHDAWGAGIAGDAVAMTIGEFQDVWAVDAAGRLQHWYWGPATGGVKMDTWGSGVTGRPAVILAGAQQHAFARSGAGALEHYWWDPATNQISHDTWGNGLVGDPTAMMIGQQQHVWAVDADGNQQHWFWDPATNAVAHDSWGK